MPPVKSAKSSDTVQTSVPIAGDSFSIPVSGYISPENIAEQIYKRNLELLRYGRRAEQLLYEVAEAVVAVNLDKQITLFNRAAETMLGIKSSDVNGKNLDDIIKIQDESGKKILLSTYCYGDSSDNKNNILENVELLAPYRSYYVNISFSAITQSDDQKEWLIAMTDITKQKELDKSKNEFISVTSHELRTPLTIIKSYLWMLANKGGDLNDKQKDYLTKAIEGSERLLSIINDTLDIARMEQNKTKFVLESLDLIDFTKSMIEDFKVKTDEKNLFLNFVPYDNNPIIITADKAKLGEIFLNFLGNALKFTQEGGIKILIDPYKEDYVKVSIVDSGLGILPEDIDRLFLKFGRLDNSYTTVARIGGTGLGLYIARNLVSKFGGDVGVTSEGLGKGSTFWFTLPIQKEGSLFDIASHSKITTLI